VLYREKGARVGKVTDSLSLNRVVVWIKGRIDIVLVPEYIYYGKIRRNRGQSPLLGSGEIISLQQDVTG
jgi:hypothetical protein